MRLIVARCEVRYSGRLDALLPEALRLIMIKSDGSVMVHADTGGYKPQNWMTPLCAKAKRRRYRTTAVDWGLRSESVCLRARRWNG